MAGLNAVTTLNKSIAKVASRGTLAMVIQVIATRVIVLGTQLILAINLTEEDFGKIELLKPSSQLSAHLLRLTSNPHSLKKRTISQA